MHKFNITNNIIHNQFYYKILRNFIMNSKNIYLYTWFNIEHKQPKT